MVGSLTLMVRNFPWPAAQHVLNDLLGPSGQMACDNLISGTFGIASLALLCALSGVSAMYSNQRRSGPFVSPIMSAVVVLACFFVVTAPVDILAWKKIFSMDQGLLLAMCVAILGSALFLRLSRFSVLQLPLDIVGHDPVVRDVFTVMPAGVATIFIFGGLRGILLASGVTDLHSFAQTLLTLPFADAKDGLGFGILYSALSQILWFFGAHGPNLLYSIEEHILNPGVLANAQALSNGLDPSNIFTKPFFDAFTRMGGSGCTLCLIMAILLKDKDLGMRKLSIFGLLPALFNVNEPLLFGIPLVLNPIYFIPFLFVPIAQTVTAYAATVFGLVPHTTATASWTTPALISGYVTTGSINGALMQGLNLIMGLFMYLPFVGISNTVREKHGKRVMHALLDVAERSETDPGRRKCLDHPGETGRLAKALASDLEKALLLSEQLYLVYQPQVGGSGHQVFGVEALLRWNHPVYGNIAPPITIALAEDSGFINQLGLFILSEACEQRAAWEPYVADTLIMSVNVSPKQLQDPEFGQHVLTILRKTEVEPQCLELEITESSMLEPDAQVLKTLSWLQEHGVRVAIDDFGMGHASLRYLRAFPVNTVKIDRSFTEGKKDDVNEQIVRSVLELSRSLNIDTIVEGVELHEQLIRFTNMGCTAYQGYYFSKPLIGEDCLAFIQKRKEVPGD